MKNIFHLLILFISLVSFGQQTKYVDFKRVESIILFNQINVDSTVFNSYEVKFDILKQADSIYLDAVNMRFENIALNGNPVAFNC